MSELKRKRKAAGENTAKMKDSNKKIKFSPLTKTKIESNSVPTTSLEDIIEKFDELFLTEEKFSEKKLKEFSKSILFQNNRKNKNDSVKLNYNNLFVVILKFSGLEIEQTSTLKNLLQKVDEENFADFELIEDIIAQTKVKSENFKTSKLYQIFETIISEIYNNYDVTSEADFSILKKFILNNLKLTQNKYRKIRFYSSLILINIFKLCFEEFIQTKKLISQKSKKKKNPHSKNGPNNLDSFVKTGNSNTSIEENTKKLLNSKAKILEEICQILKEKFIFKKISDISKNIRLTICDYIVKISKTHFVELFSDRKLVKFYPFFLIDSSNNIKSKYLQLIYEKLDFIEEENFEDEDAEEEGDDSNSKNKLSENSTINTILQILSIGRDAILNICVKEDKLIAKQAIKIIELLSQYNILENKTVQAMLPHLFNPESQIRNLISKIVVNYILNFEKEKKRNQDEQAEENEDDGNFDRNSQSLGKKAEKNSKVNLSVEQNNNLKVSSIENLIETLQFFFRLADNEEKMVKVLVDNFYDKLNIFKHFNIFFDLIYYILYNSGNNIANIQNNLDIKCGYDDLLQTCLIVLNYSIEKIQNEIESNSADNIQLITKNEEFVNLLLNNSTGIIKKMRISLNSATQSENFFFFLNLYDKFKIYPQNLIKFDFEIISELAKELKNSFFTNVNFIDETDELNENLFENLNEMLLKTLNKLLVYSKDKFHRLQSLDEIIFSESSSSLGKDYCEMLFNILIKSDIYQKLSNIPVDEFEANFSLNLNNNFKNLATNFKHGQMKTFYLLISQFNYLLIYFRDIFNFLIAPSNVVSSPSYNSLNLQNFSTFLQNLIRFVWEKHDRTELQTMNWTYKISEASLKLIETIHLVCLNNILSSSEWKEIDSYINYRNKIFYTISYVVNDLAFFTTIKSDTDSNSNVMVFKKYNNNVLKLKTFSINVLLEMLIYISSEKILNPHLKFSNIDEKFPTDMIENFLKSNFVKFYLDYNKYLKEKAMIQSEETINQNQNDKQTNNPKNSQVNNLNTQNFVNSSLMENSIFIEELSLKTFCIKSLMEKFSRLLILNLGIFKYTNFCCLYFETFYLVKMPVIIENFNSFVFENLLEKEITHYVKNSQEANNNLNILIFYLTKITMRIFTNKSKIFSLQDDSMVESESNLITKDDKIEMISRFANYYFKGMKKMKVKFAKENVGMDISKKDKLFYENFIINSINFALESKKEIYEDVENLEIQQNEESNFENKSGNDSKKNFRIEIENVKFFEIIRMYLKNSVFFNENDLKNILMIFIKLSKNVMLLENVTRFHIKILEKFKSFLLNKAKVFISENDNERKKDGDENVEMMDVEENTTKKEVTEESNFEQEVDEEDNDDDDGIEASILKNDNKKRKNKENVKSEKRENRKRKYKDVNLIFNY
jgi:hypothetical protein